MGVAESNLFDLDETMEAARRWRAVLRDRKDQVEAAKRGRVSKADNSDRIHKNANYLIQKADNTGVALPSSLREDLERIAGVGARGVVAEMDDAFLERTIGKTRDYLSFAFLETGVFRGRSVGHVIVPTDRGTAHGTGFLVSPRLLLTNHHVLPDADTASRSTVEFDFEIDRENRRKPIRAFALKPDIFFLNDKALDFALVAVSDNSSDGQSLAGFGFCPLIATEGKILVGNPVNIIQHPNGEPKQVVLRENRLVNLDKVQDADFYAHYTTDTEPGSSGSPVFNDQWDVIALHHRGVPAMNDKGALLDVDGRVWKSGDHPARLCWVANEGIRISRLVRAIQKAPLAGLQAKLRDELLAEKTIGGSMDEQSGDAPTRPPRRRDDDVLPTSQIGPQRRAGDGSFRRIVHIPLRLTIEIGDPVTGDDVRVSLADSDADVDESAKPDADYAKRKGFDRRFLGVEAPLPTPPARDVLTFGSGRQSELKYHHYSVIMHRERKLAIVSAVNVDLGTPHRTKREGKDRWFFDPRIPEDAQVGNEAYAGNDLDRGHLTRRADAAWGQTEAEAERANNDTFHFTNCSPQHEVFNQATLANRRGLKLWGGLEEHIAGQGKNNVRKLCVFNGPIFGANDRMHRGVVRLPKEFWKVVACRDDRGRLKVYAFVLSQEDLIRSMPEEEFRPGPYAPFQIRLSDLARRTGLDFGDLARHDSLAAAGSDELFESTLGDVVPIQALEDVVL